MIETKNNNVRGIEAKRVNTNFKNHKKFVFNNIEIKNIKNNIRNVIFKKVKIKTDRRNGD